MSKNPHKSLFLLLAMLSVISLSALPGSVKQIFLSQENKKSAAVQDAAPSFSRAYSTSTPAIPSGLLPQAQAATIPQIGYPVTLEIPSIGLVAPIVKTGLEADGSLHVPALPSQIGWYDLGPKPGDIGPAILTGHLDSAAGPGVLHNLKKVRPKDIIEIVRDDGSTAEFLVDTLQSYPQDNFNSQAVYGPITTAGLRIITCDGSYNKTTQHYNNDLVVYATLKQLLSPGQYQPK